MPKLQQDSERISHGANLLISILVRYPEIGTVNYDADTGTINLTFMLSGTPAAAELAAIEERLLASIDAYHSLEGIKDGSAEVWCSTCDQVAMLTLRRDVGTLSRGEIALVIALLHEGLQDRLIADENDAILEEDLLVQEEVIGTMLESMKQDHNGNGLIGIREDGRVLVFNK
ncbi:hypothetical protein [Anaeroselena agilis]|uniref:Uncharacterized protein n=1 Tax=Anaeroselena agilis TaxID=3063788 RepID=A0ABU3NX43_9FIRM|nr:hypothetical protein [Selenomonadales bacterium 4137-cl]